jgi:hypothetical protein
VAGILGKLNSKYKNSGNYKREEDRNAKEECGGKGKKRHKSLYICGLTFWDIKIHLSKYICHMVAKGSNSE